MKNSNTVNEVLETGKENENVETTTVVELSIKDKIFGWFGRNKGVIITGAIGVVVGVVGAYALNSSTDDEPSDDKIFTSLEAGE
jgi:hypothetical protein